MRKYVIIGDVHGRSTWKGLVDPEAVNIFVGDYFDPYDRELVPELCVDNMNDILDFKKNHPDNVVLLIGNHDVHYWDGPCNVGCSRYNRPAAINYHNIMRNNEDLFSGVAYNIEDKCVVSHAGISVYWYEAWKEFWERKESGKPILWSYDLMQEKVGYIIRDRDRNVWTYHGKDLVYNPGEVVDFCNRLWSQGGNRHYEFDFSKNQIDPHDSYGDSLTHGPLWIRLESLYNADLFKGSGIAQVVGHTQTIKIVHVEGEGSNIFYIDVLGMKHIEQKNLTVNVKTEENNEKQLIFNVL